MAYALVGTIGVASQGASGAAVTPAWGTGESRTAGNLLICFCSVTGSATVASTPSGWTSASNAGGTSCGAIIFYKIAAGVDAAPTIAAITGGVIAAQLAEFSGNTATPLDQISAIVGTSSPITATYSSPDTASAELMIIASGDFRSVARTPTDTLTSNHATITQAGNNNGTSSVNHYSFGYSLATTSNASTDTAVMTASVTTSITGLVLATVTFKRAPITCTATDAPTTSESSARIRSLTRILTESLRGSDTTPGLNSGDNITTWPDSSGNGNNATAVGTVPFEIASATPLIHFNGTASYFTLATPIPAGGPWTIIALMFNDFNTGSQASLANLTSNLACLGPFWHTLNNIYIANQSVAYSGSTWNPSGGWHVFTAKSDMTFLMDNVSQVMTFYSNVSGATAFTDIGNRAGAENAHGYLIELMAFNSLLSSTDIANINQYLSNTYPALTLGITGGTATPPSFVGGLIAWWKSSSFLPAGLANRTLSSLRSPVDAPNTAESLPRVLSLLRSDTDSPATAEITTGSRVFSRIIPDAISTSEVIARIKSGNRTTPDALLTSGLASRSATQSRSETDAPTTSESVSGGKSIAGSTSDSPNTTEGILGLSDGNLITTWPDSSGHGHNAVQSGTARPVFKTNIVNGKPVVRFVAANGNYFSLANPIPGSTAFTCIVVWRPSGVNAELMSIANSTSPAPFGLAQVSNNTYIDDRVGYGQVSGNIFYNGSFRIIIGTINGSGGGIEFFADQTGVFPDTTGAFASAVDFDTIGARLSTPEYSDGDMAEFLFCNVQLSNTDRQNVEKTLGAKYGITIPLGSIIDLSALTGLVSWWKADALAPFPYAARVLNLIRATPDAPTTSESSIRLISAPRTLTDHPFTSEVVTKSGPQIRATVDALTISESMARILTALRTCTDHPVLSESLAKILSLFRTVTDHPFTSESATGLKIKLGAAVDSLSTAESVSRLLTALRTTSDNPSVAEIITRAWTTQRTATDHPATSESAIVSRLYIRSIVDALSVVELAQRILMAHRNGAESPSVSESVVRLGAYSRILVDAMSISDITFRTMAIQKLSLDSLLVSDDALLSLILNRVGTDLLQTAEVARRPFQQRFVEDALLVSDVALWNLPRIINILVALELAQQFNIVLPQDLLAINILSAIDPINILSIVVPTDQQTIDIPLTINPTLIDILVSGRDQ